MLDRGECRIQLFGNRARGILEANECAGALNWRHLWSLIYEQLVYVCLYNQKAWFRSDVALLR